MIQSRRGRKKLSLLLKLQAVDEHRLQLVDVVRGLYGDAEPPRGAGEPTAGVARGFRVRLAHVQGIPADPHRSLVLVDVQVVALWQQAVVVLRRPAMVVVVVLGPGAVAGAVGRAVGHHARLQAAVPPHGPVQVQPGDQRLANVDAFGPVDGFVVHGGEGALKAHGEDQLLLSDHGLEEKKG